MSLGSITVVEAPETEPVTVAELRAHCRIDHADDNSYLSALITAARKYVEDRTGKLLAEQTIHQIHDEFPCGATPIKLQRMPVSSVEVTYIDEDGAEQTMDEDLIQTSLNATIPLIAPVPDEDWPDTESERLGAVTIEITGGYETCPADLKQAIMMLAAHWYANREPVTEAKLSEVPLSVEAIIGINASPLIF